MSELSELATEASLAERDLPDLVQLLQEQEWTGLLSLHRGLATKNITVEKGRLVFATSSDPDERLGFLLMKRGVITLRQLSDAGKRVVPGKRLGTLLVEDGVLSAKGLVKAVIDASREIILHAFTWAEGRYKLEAGQRPSEAITLNIDPPQLILDGIRRIESWKRIDRAVGGLDALYRCRREGAHIAQKLELSPDEKQITGTLARTRSVEWLCAQTKLSSFDVCRLLWALRVVGFAERVTTAISEAAADDDGLGAVLAEPNGQG
jgi:hypothetical protein